MILRKKKICRNSDEISLQVSYSLPDIKRQLKDYYAVIGQLVCTEQDLLHYFGHTLFKIYEPKHADELSKWALKLSLRNGLIIQSVTDINVYYLSESLGTRKPGRPTKEETM